MKLLQDTGTCRYQGRRGVGMGNRGEIFKRPVPLPEPPATYDPTRRAAIGIASLELREDAALFAATLPRHHHDPLDRMLICQSIVHGLTILSPDTLFAQYPVKMLW